MLRVCNTGIVRKRVTNRLHSSLPNTVKMTMQKDVQCWLISAFFQATNYARKYIPQNVEWGHFQDFPTFCRAFISAHRYLSGDLTQATPSLGPGDLRHILVTSHLPVFAGIPLIQVSAADHRSPDELYRLMAHPCGVSGCPVYHPCYS